MRIIVHRGSHQIGGSCIEISSGATRIILDAGLPLEPDEAAGHLPPAVCGLFDTQGPPVDVLLLTHAHPDHSGLVAATRAGVPVFMTEGTSKMMLAGSLFARQPGLSPERRQILRERQTKQVGSLRVTTIPVDHSIYGATAFLLEGEGRRVLYTGDLRWHGRKPGMARRLARAVAAHPLDALIIEGTRLGTRAAEQNTSEVALEDQLAKDLRVAPGLVLTMYSPLNVDRFVTMYRAARRSGRRLVIDPYQAFVLHLIHRHAQLPMPGKSDLGVLIPPRFALSRAGRRLRRTSWYAALPQKAVDLADVLAAPRDHIALFRPSMLPWFAPRGLPHNSTTVFSYWPGYLREEPMVAFASEIKKLGATQLQRHASGHAHADDLRAFVHAIKPARLIPVHTTAPRAFAQFWPQTIGLRDGVPFVLD